MAKKQLGVAPSGAIDAATKGYVDGLPKRTVQTVTTTTTLGSSGDYVVFIGASGAPTLPTAVGNTGRYTFKNIDTVDRTISTTSPQTIDGSATTWTLSPGAAIEVVSDGTGWRVF